MAASITLPGTKQPEDVFDPRYSLIMTNAPLYRDHKLVTVSDEEVERFSLTKTDAPVSKYRASLQINFGPQDILSPEAAAALNWPSANKWIRDAAAAGDIEIVNFPMDPPNAKGGSHRRWSDESLDLNVLIERSEGKRLGAFGLGNALLGLMGTEDPRVGTRIGGGEISGLLYVKPEGKGSDRKRRAFHFELVVCDMFYYAYLLLLRGKTFASFLETNPPDPPREPKPDLRLVKEEEATGLLGVPAPTTSMGEKLKVAMARTDPPAAIQPPAEPPAN